MRDATLRLSLRTKLLLGVLLLLLPVLGLLLWGIQATYERGREQVLDRQVGIAQTIAVQVDGLFDECTDLAWALANDPLVRSFDPALVDPHLQRLAPRYSEYLDIEVYNARGESVGTSVPYAPGQPRLDGTQSLLFRRVLASSQPGVSEVHQTPRFEGRPVVSIAVPVLEDERATGTVHLVFDLSQLPPSVASPQLDPQEFGIAVIDPAGRVAFYNRLPDLAWEQRDVSRLPETQAGLAGQTVRTDAFTSPYFGDRRVLGQVRSPRYGWLVAVASPLAVALAPAEEELRRDLLAFGLIALAGIAGAWALSRSLVGPLGQLAALARDLGRGQLGRRSELRTGDELETLGQEFDAMAQLLQRTLGELEAERARLQAVIEQMPEAVILADAHGHVLLYNRLALLALAQGETGQVDTFGNPAILDLRRASGEPAPWEELPLVRAVLQREITRGVELCVRRADGALVPVLASAAPIRGPGGEVVGAVAVYRDISSLKELERLREEWTSVIAHDLRQPVTVINGYAGLLARLMERHPAVPQEQQAVEHIRTSAHQLNRMIADLLDVSRIEAGRLALERQPQDLATLVRQVAERTAEVAAGHPVQVEVAEAPLPVEADPQRIEQVLGNLVSNAAKYGDPDTGILIEVRRRDTEVEVAVANHGPGIPPEDLPRLFSRFHRARQAQAERVAGLGLGLYISKGLVEAHGGRIWAESAPGQTTTFRFTLPLAAPQRVAGERAA
ncbi:MAG: PAS domain S-box protein [Chloroflexi bacterium]|nr:PAS domain S-box protein [Chloroflexota bacterium]